MSLQPTVLVFLYNNRLARCVILLCIVYSQKHCILLIG